MNIAYAQSSNVTIINSMFMNTSQNGIVVMNSDYVEIYNYLEIENCTLNECRNYIVYASKVAEISIQNSYFEYSSTKMIHITQAKTVKITSSGFVTFSQVIMVLSTFQPLKDMNLYTWQSSFGNKTWSITTNDTEFIKKKRQKSWELFGCMV